MKPVEPVFDVIHLLFELVSVPTTRLNIITSLKKERDNKYLTGRRTDEVSNREEPLNCFVVVFVLIFTNFVLGWERKTFYCTKASSYQYLRTRNFSPIRYLMW